MDGGEERSPLGQTAGPRTVELRKSIYTQRASHKSHHVTSGRQTPRAGTDRSSRASNRQPCERVRSGSQHQAPFQASACESSPKPAVPSKRDEKRIRADGQAFWIHYGSRGIYYAYQSRSSSTRPLTHARRALFWRHSSPLRHSPVFACDGCCALHGVCT